MPLNTDWNLDAADM